MCELSDENVLQLSCVKRRAGGSTRQLQPAFHILADASKMEDHTFHCQLGFTGDGSLMQDQSVDTLFIKNYQLFKNSLRVMTYEGAAGTYKCMFV